MIPVINQFLLEIVNGFQDTPYTNIARTSIKLTDMMENINIYIEEIGNETFKDSNPHREALQNMRKYLTQLRLHLEENTLVEFELNFKSYMVVGALLASLALLVAASANLGFFQLLWLYPLTLIKLYCNYINHCYYI